MPQASTFGSHSVEAHPLHIQPAVHIKLSKEERSHYREQYDSLKYISNYVSVFDQALSDNIDSRIRKENEALLKKYYESRKPFTFTSFRQGSVISSSDSSTGFTERTKTYCFLNDFVSNCVNEVDPYTLKMTVRNRNTALNMENLDDERKSKDDIYDFEDNTDDECNAKCHGAFHYSSERLKFFAHVRQYRTLSIIKSF